MNGPNNHLVNLTVRYHVFGSTLRCSEWNRGSDIEQNRRTRTRRLATSVHRKYRFTFLALSRFFFTGSTLTVIVDRRIHLLKNCLFEEEPVTHVTPMLCVVKIVVGSSRLTVLSLWNSSHPPPIQVCLRLDDYKSRSRRHVYTVTSEHVSTVVTIQSPSLSRPA